MNAGELYKAGRLPEAIEAQIQEVKANPIDNGKRLFLFELLAFAGELDRARRQIDVVKYDDADLDMATLSYRRLLDSEEARRKLFAEGLPPGFFGDPSEHLRLRLAAVQQLREKRFDEAAESLARAIEATPTFQGSLNEQPFQSLRDEDDIFSGLIEVMALGRYFWVGFEQIHRLTINPPKFPRDLLFLPAHLELEEESGDVFLPTLYPGSHEHPDDMVKLGRLTAWKELDGGLAVAVGLHSYLRDDEPISLLEWRELKSEGESEPPAPDIA
jgi:type VI secretion system protein ImpE